MVKPKLKGSKNNPDVLVRLELLAFNIGADENVERNTRATIRLNMGKDERSRSDQFETAYWSIAAGLRLFERGRGKSKPKDFQVDFHRAFSKRPIEVPGGLATLSFEVVKHREPNWWQKLFGFAKGNIGEKLISVLGFPAITNDSIQAIDTMLNQLADSNHDVLFQSRPIKLALSQKAKKDCEHGQALVKIGALNEGICILARGKDWETIAGTRAVFNETYQRLLPSDVTERQIVSGTYDDPLEQITYGVLRVRTKATNLDPNFGFEV